ncbi:MAG: acyl-CoA dehydrogenase family protein [Spirochaetia bacterium]|nr:acyl-CoA dehydrogenase family protein [Spirochaetia bacterium]
MKKDVLEAYRIFAEKSIKKNISQYEEITPDLKIKNIYESAIKNGLIAKDKGHGYELWEDVTSKDSILFNIKAVSILSEVNAGISFHLAQMALGTLFRNKLKIKENKIFVLSLESQFNFFKNILDPVAVTEQNNYSFFLQASEYWEEVIIPFIDNNSIIQWVRLKKTECKIYNYENSHGINETNFIKIIVPINLLYQNKIKINSNTAKTLYLEACILYMLSIMAVAYGAALSAYKKAIKYSEQREQGGSVIKNHFYIQNTLSEIKLNLKNCEDIFQNISIKSDRKESLFNILRYKLTVMPYAFKSANLSLQIFGGYGYMKEFGIEKIVRDINHLSLLGGSCNQLKQAYSQLSNDPFFLKKNENLNENIYSKLILKAKIKTIDIRNYNEYLWTKDTQNLPNSLQKYRKHIKDFANKHLKEVSHKLDLSLEKNIQIDTLKKAAKAGLFSDFLPFPFGSKKLKNYFYTDTLLQCIKLEEISSVCGGLGLLLGANALGILPVFLSKNKKLIRKFIIKSSRLALKEKLQLFSFAITEPSGGSDLQNTKGASLYKSVTCAKKVKDGYLLNGRKCFISNGSFSFYFTVFAVIDKDDMSSYTCFLIDKNMKGFSLGRDEKKMGQRASPASELIFDNVFVPNSNVIGKAGDGWMLSQMSLKFSRIPTAAISLGIARSALESLIEFVSMRQNYLYNIADIESEITQLIIQVSAARLMLWKTAASKKITPDSAALTKVFCSDTAVEVCLKVMDLMGSQGFLYENKAEKAFRDARLTQIYEGTNFINKLVLVENLNYNFNKKK